MACPEIRLAVGMLLSIVCPAIHAELGRLVSIGGQAIKNAAPKKINGGVFHRKSSILKAPIQYPCELNRSQKIIESRIEKKL